MKFRVGLENNYENRSLAWVLDYPGCFCYGSDASGAWTSVPEAIREYAAWLERKSSGQIQLDTKEVEPILEETWNVFSVNEGYERAPEGYEVNAWFLHDWKPLTAEDIARGLHILEWTRQDLLDSVKDLSDEQMQVRLPGERWSIAGIVKHVGGAEWWYQDRLGKARPRSELPGDIFERIIQMRRDLNALLPSLVGSKQVAGADAEFWSPRKMLRRAVWHERDHTGHILRLRNAV